MVLKHFIQKIIFEGLSILEPTISFFCQVNSKEPPHSYAFSSLSTQGRFRAFIVADFISFKSSLLLVKDTLLVKSWLVGCCCMIGCCMFVSFWVDLLPLHLLEDYFQVQRQVFFLGFIFISCTVLWVAHSKALVQFVQVVSVFISEITAKMFDCHIKFIFFNNFIGLYVQNLQNKKTKIRSTKTNKVIKKIGFMIV